MKYPLVRQWLMDHAGLEPSLLDGPGFESLVSLRIASQRAMNEAMYVATLERMPEEVDQLTAGIAVPETWLFRYPRSFDLLVEFLQRRLAANERENRALQMCSIGCATGQEPYSMAMCALHAGWPASHVQVTGIDRNQDFLRAARAAEYGSASVRTEIPSWAMQYLRHSDECIGIDPAVRAMVQFAQTDISQPNAFDALPPCDVIFCRNVLIYLNTDVRGRLLEAIANMLTPDGLLFVGHAEQMIRPAHQMQALRPIPIAHAFALERVTAELQRNERAPEIVIPSARQLHQLTPRNDRTMEPVAPQVVAPPSRLGVGAAREETLDDARALADAGRTHEVEPMVRSIIARRGPSASAFELLGMIRMTANDADGAKRLFEQAVYLEPTRSTSLLQLALISEKAGDNPRAQMLWERAKRASANAEQEVRR